MFKNLFFTMIFIGGHAFAGELDGNTFCRVIQSDGSFGQPKGERLNCLTFTNNTMIDDADTFFGNPQEIESYIVVDNQVWILEEKTLSPEYDIIYNKKGEAIDLIATGQGSSAIKGTKYTLMNL